REPPASAVAHVGGASGRLWSRAATARDRQRAAGRRGRRDRRRIRRRGPERDDPPRVRRLGRPPPHPHLTTPQRENSAIGDRRRSLVTENARYAGRIRNSAPGLPPLTEISRLGATASDSVDKGGVADLVHRADGTEAARAHAVDHVAS